MEAFVVIIEKLEYFFIDSWAAGVYFTKDAAKEQLKKYGFKSDGYHWKAEIKEKNEGGYINTTEYEAYIQILETEAPLRAGYALKKAADDIHKGDIC